MDRERDTYLQRIRTHLSTSYLLSEEKIENVLPKFLGSIKTLMAELEELSVSDKNDALSRAGHTMKGALLNLGLPDLAELAFSVEKHQQLCDNDRDCVQLVNELKQEIRKIL